MRPKQPLNCLKAPAGPMDVAGDAQPGHPAPIPAGCWVFCPCTLLTAPAPGKGEVCKAPSRASASPPSSTAASSLIASEPCQQLNPNPVSFTVLLPALLTSERGEKSNAQPLSWLNPSSKGHAGVSRAVEAVRCPSLDT